jgi:cAMP phosphodiesterase
MLVDNDVLIDAGTGVGDLALADLYTIRHVFLTHAHLDHIAGLPMLVDANFEDHFELPVTVYAREETLDAIKTHLFNDVIWPDFAGIPNRQNAILRYVTLDPGQSVSIGQRQFRAVDVHHSVPSLGFTVQNSAGAFAVSGDTKTNETLWPALNACDDLRVLVIEVSFPDEQRALADAAGHYCPETMCRDLERLRHRPEIWLTGMKPGEEERILRQVIQTAPSRNVRMLARSTVIDV